MTKKGKINTLNKNYKELSIQVSLSGLSFCVLDSLEQKVEDIKHFNFENIYTLDSLLVQLDYHLASNNIHQNTYNKVHVIHENELSTFVPRPLFNENNLADYLKFNIKILANDFITFDEIPNTDLINVYVPYAHVNNFIFDHFGEFEYKHFSTVLVETLINKTPKSENPVMYVHVQPRHFEIVVLKNRKLILYNTFDYLTKEDFIYYILFTAEQLDLNPETFQLHFLGHIDENNELHKIVYDYIRNVSIHDPSLHFEFKEETEVSTPIQQFILLNSF